MNKILSKNIVEVIENDLYWFGISYVKEVYNKVCYVNTTNRDFTIKTSRRDSLWIDDISPKYICSLTFINTLGLEVLTLDFSENTAIVIIDNIYTFDEFNMKDLTIPILFSSSNPSIKYTIRLERYDSNLIKFTIYSNQIYEKLHFYLNLDDFSNLLYSMYFSWLIDIDNGNDISLLEGVYSKLIQ